MRWLVIFTGSKIKNFRKKGHQKRTSNRERLNEDKNKKSEVSCSLITTALFLSSSFLFYFGYSC